MTSNTKRDVRRAVSFARKRFPVDKLRVEGIDVKENDILRVVFLGLGFTIDRTTITLSWVNDGGREYHEFSVGKLWVKHLGRPKWDIR